MNKQDKQQIPLFDEIKLQTKVIIPILQGLRKEIGKEKADKLIIQVLRPHVRSVYHQIGERKTGSPKERWEKVWDELRPRIGDNVEREFLKNDDEGHDYNVKRCKFAEFFKELGEPELGKILLCDFDFYVAEVGAPVIELTRTQTIMEGADHCDFCYRFKNV